MGLDKKCSCVGEVKARQELSLPLCTAHSGYTVPSQSSSPLSAQVSQPAVLSLPLDYGVQPTGMSQLSLTTGYESSTCSVCHFGAHRRLNSSSGIQLTANNWVSLPCIRRVIWKKHEFNKLAGASIYFWFIFSVYAVLNRLLLGRETVKIPSGKQFSLRIKIRDK